VILIAVWFVDYGVECSARPIFPNFIGLVELLQLPGKLADVRRNQREARKERGIVEHSVLANLDVLLPSTRETFPDNSPPTPSPAIVYRGQRLFRQRNVNPEDSHDD
jgi:hypothetical protein